LPLSHRVIARATVTGSGFRRLPGAPDAARRPLVCQRERPNSVAKRSRLEEAQPTVAGKGSPPARQSPRGTVVMVVMRASDVCPASSPLADLEHAENQPGQGA